jgi:hypothetical protein
MISKRLRLYGGVEGVVTLPIVCGGRACVCVAVRSLHMTLYICSALQIATRNHLAMLPIHAPIISVPTWIRPHDPHLCSVLSTFSHISAGLDLPGPTVLQSLTRDNAPDDIAEADSDVGRKIYRRTYTIMG